MTQLYHSISLLDIYPAPTEFTTYYRDICINMSITALLTTSKKWNQTRDPFTIPKRWIVRKMWHIYIMESHEEKLNHEICRKMDRTRKKLLSELNKAHKDKDNVFFLKCRSLLQTIV